MKKIDSEILKVYEKLKNEIKLTAIKKDTNKCLEKVSELWMFMNRFRNCDLQKYFDEDIYQYIESLNQDKVSENYYLKKNKKEYRICFIVVYLNDFGGASIPHRFMLDKFEWKGNIVKNYFLISNFFKEDEKETDSLNYLRNEIKPEKICFLPKDLNHKERGDAIKSFLVKNKIDFVVAQLCPSTIYALSSKCVPIVANLSQDCYTFTLGPGFGDITYLVTLDQIFKYKYRNTSPQHFSKIIMLPLHSAEQLKKATKLNLKKFNIPKNSIVSGSTNMWKTFFGDGEILLEGIAALIRRYPFYHHIFIGTPRCLDNLENYLMKNPDLRENIHYIGPVQNIYRILKSLDFWVNSFPTTGGSNIEMANMGKPTIDIAINRNLDLHPAEFLRFNECIVISLEEFIELGSKFINNDKYRRDIGSALKSQISREFDKENLVYERIYKELLVEYIRRTEGIKRLQKIEIDSTIDYEKRISLYNSYGKKNWDLDLKEKWLKDCTKKYPEKTFAWIKLLEEAILEKNYKKFKLLEKKINHIKMKDYRLNVYIAKGYLEFDSKKEALDKLLKIIDDIKFDKVPIRMACRIYLLMGKDINAVKILRKIRPEVNIENIQTIINQEPLDEIPIYYDY